jgi:hypothetical protein
MSSDDTKRVFHTLAELFSFLYGVVAMLIGLSYAFIPDRATSGALRAATLVLPLTLWGWFFMVAGALVLATLVVHKLQNISHLIAGCLWAAWTGVIVSAAITGLISVGAPFSVMSLLFGHLILSMHYRKRGRGDHG